jgi:hypothetical protein
MASMRDNYRAVGRHRLDPAAVRDIAFLQWLRETGRVGGPGTER